MDGSREIVILVHGIWMRPLIMKRIAAFLERQGYQTVLFSYPSLRKSVFQNAALLHQAICDLKSGGKVHLVGHSLGGLVILHCLHQFKELPIDKVIMLGSPIKGSFLARHILKLPILSSLLGKSMEQGLSGDNVPQWDVKYSYQWGMIAGCKNRGIAMLFGGLPEDGDGTVMLSETKHELQRDYIKMAVGHTGLLFSDDVFQQVLSFLKSGKFQKGQK